MTTVEDTRRSPGFALPEPTAAAPAPDAPRRIANPLPMAVALLGLQLLIYGFRWVGVTPETLHESPLGTALNYSILVAGAAQLLAGVLALIRGDGYVGHVAATFGLWLLGQYLLVTHEGVEPASVAWYLFTLIIPLAIITVPAIIQRRIAFVVAFGAIITLLLLAGLGFLDLQAAADAKGPADVSVAVSLLGTSAWFAFIAAACLFWLLGKTLLEETGVGARRRDRARTAA